MNEFERRALEYVRNTADGATLGRFIEDHEPVGEALWRALRAGPEAKAKIDPATGRIRLTPAGERTLAD